MGPGLGVCQTVMALSDTPNDESHDGCPRLPGAFRLARQNRSLSRERTPRTPHLFGPPTPLPQTGEGRFLSRWSDFHSKETFSSVAYRAAVGPSLAVVADTCNSPTCGLWKQRLTGTIGREGTVKKSARSSH